MKMGKKNKNKQKNKPFKIKQLFSKKPVGANFKQDLSQVKEFKQTIQDRPMELRFSPTAWAKLLFMRDVGPTEIGGFGITRADDLLYVEDFVTVKQICTSVSVEFDDDDVADFTLDMVDDGLHPRNFMRIWIHTHPNISPSPSGTDEDTFRDKFGHCDWAVMAILSKDNRSYCRIQINDGPIRGSIEIPMLVDFTSYNFLKSDYEAWLEEFEENVTQVQYSYQSYDSYHNNFPYSPSTHNNKEYKSAFGAVEPESEFDIIESETLNEIPSDDALIYPSAEFQKRYNQDGITIPNEIEEYIDANTMIILEYMSPGERQYVFDELRSKHKIGD